MLAGQQGPVAEKAELLDINDTSTVMVLRLFYLVYSTIAAARLLISLSLQFFLFIHRLSGRVLEVTGQGVSTLVQHGKRDCHAKRTQ